MKVLARRLRPRSLRLVHPEALEAVSVLTAGQSNQVTEERGAL